VPQRTNHFQELVSLIRRSLARNGDTIDDSVMVWVEELEAEREVDILHQTTEGTTRVKIAVEAKDEGRKLDVTAIEAIHGKYQGEGGVPADRVVVVSSSGFTTLAIRRAKHFGIDLFTIAEAKELDWSKFAAEHAAVKEHTTWDITLKPHVYEIRLTPRLPSHLDADIRKYGVVRCPGCSEAHHHGDLATYARSLTLDSREPAMAVWLGNLKEFCRGRADGGRGEVKFGLPSGTGIRHDGKDYPIKEIRVKIQALDATCQVSHTPFLMSQPGGDDRLVHQLTAELGVMNFRWVMPDGMKSQKLGLKVESKNPKERAERRKARRKKVKTKKS
jgi:hypothetical protein